MAASNPLPYVVAESARKRQVMNSSPLRYFLSAVMAGGLIAVVLIVSLLLGQALHLAGSPMYYAASAGFFGTALCTIIVSKTELFTSNVMYMAVGLLSRRVSWKELGKSWFLVYAGNFTGALLLALMYAQTGALSHLPANHLLFDVIGHKVHADSWAIFWKGALCNWIICLAVWVPLRLSNDMAKLAMTMLLVFVFFFSGYEHSIANMAFFSLSWFASAGVTPDWADTLHNLIPATLGNIAGGAIGVAALNFYLERDTLEEVGHSLSKQEAALAHS
ncbi:formate/nitrite transporter family protein [Paludibacterium purpuratum]|uniref:Nitrite transporter NirC n=1 Tax=Paludibacterium purpuratum TaxID=1144873 RepID=A0A4R7B2F3_9NEIS|nr:formate/nitrite transporter family protein [Paludibacterium purpuratum]TDR77918.1 nitrite transporter NirC [Paludibacterium purpuratum]